MDHAEKHGPHGESEIVWFAGMAMQSIVAKLETVPDTPAEREEVALWSFRLAQAMVEMKQKLHVEG